MGTLVGACHCSAQTTNAFDQASDPAYAGLGAPDGLATGGQNGGTGFEPWTFSVGGSGGSFIQNNGPSGFSFDMWNTAADSATVAVRPFSVPLSPGQSFSVQLRLNSLDSNLATNMLALQDGSGNILFAYWHVGFESNPNNGSYHDAATSAGVATNFTYAYQQFKKFTFTLNSPTNYTFSDAGTGASFTGVISNAQIAQVSFLRRNGAYTPPNGQDFQFDQLLISAASPASFQSVAPAPDSLSAPAGGPISLQVVSGGVLLNTNAVSMTVDGGSVTPTVGGSGSLMSVSYSPSPALSQGTLHTARVIVEDENTVPYTNSWSFTTGYPSLPVVLPGPFSTSNGIDKVIFSAAGEGWLGTNYDAGSSKTLYVRQSMVFWDLNGEVANDGSGGCYGGLHFFNGGAERLLTGQSWRRNTWSLDDKAGGDIGELSLPPETTVVVGEWHTVVTRVDYTPGGNAHVSVWLDPDFGQTEANQPYPPLQVEMDNTFDNIRLRCGNGTANATWTNIIVAATSAGVGFVAPAAPQFQGFVPGMNASSAAPSTPIAAEILLGSYAIDTNNVQLTLDGNNVTPSFVVTSNSISLNYQPAVPFEPGSFHSVMLSVTDANSDLYSTGWSFTVDVYPTLPATLADSTNGTVDAFGGGAGTTIWNSQNGWLAGNYGPTSSNTLYMRFSVNFLDLNGETGDGGGFGGFHLYQGNTEVLLIGNNWGSTNWSIDDITAPDVDLTPQTPVVLGEWHTMVVKTEFVPNADDNITIWLDPDFEVAEGAQPNAPVTFAANNSFDSVHLRAGNGSAYAQFTNIVVGATAPDVGFPETVPPALLSIQLLGGNVDISWSGAGILQEAPSITGTWVDSGDQSNPQSRPATNSAQFFRIKQ